MKKYLLLLLVPALFFFNCGESTLEDGNAVYDFTPTPPPAGYPNSKNTGLTNQSLLSTDLSSLKKISLGWEATTGQTVENLEIRGRLILRGDNITVRNCRIWGDEPNSDGFAKGYCLQIKPGENIMIENCELGRDKNSWPNHIYGAVASEMDNFTLVNITVRKNYFRYLHDGIFFASKDNATIVTTIEDNYFVYIWAEDGEAGNDIDDHKGDGIESNGPLSNSTIRHNSIDVPPSQTSCILVQTNWGALDNITIDNNWLNGAGYSLKVRKRDNSLTNVTITNNLFGRDCEHGPFDAYETTQYLNDSNIFGNKWADNGEPIETLKKIK